jgi:hypothetical protein
MNESFEERALWANSVSGIDQLVTKFGFRRIEETRVSALASLH